MNTPLILTAAFDDNSQRYFNEKRKQYFPPHINYIDAHLTLFHQLPMDESRVSAALQAACATQKPVPLFITAPVSIGKGVAYKVESKELAAIHKMLVQEWSSFLIPQDKQKLYPHVTVQNKVTPAESQRLLKVLQEEFVPFTAYATALVLWKYLNGPWQWYQTIPFCG